MHTNGIEQLDIGSYNASLAFSSTDGSMIELKDNWTMDNNEDATEE